MFDDENNTDGENTNDLEGNENEERENEGNEYAEGSEEESNEATDGDTEADNNQEGSSEVVPKTYKLKIDGEEVEATEEQLVRMAQMSAASHKRFQEASNMSKSSKTILEAAKKDPIKFLTHPELGLSKAEIRAALETYLGEQIMYEQMTEDQRRAIDNERELKRLREEKQTIEQTQEEQKKAQAVQHYQAQYEKEFLSALQTVEIPKTPETVSRMAAYMKKSISRGIELTSVQAAQLVKEDYVNEFNSMFSNMEPEKLAQFIGDKTISKLSKAQAKKLLKNNINQSNDDNDIKMPKKKKAVFDSPGSFANYLDSIENS